MLLRLKQFLKKSPVSLTSENNQTSYFKEARSWANDIYTEALVSRQRYKIAFFAMCGLSSLLVLSVMVLVPTQHTELVVVHEGDSGYRWISTTKPHTKMPQTWQQAQAEIAHYVRTREAYDPLLYRHQTQSVKLFSLPQVQAEYALAQSSDNANAPINVLGAKGYRTVVIHNVLPVDNTQKNNTDSHKHVNLAQVNFEVVDHWFGQTRTTREPYSAIVSWTYQGIPLDPNKKLENWDGFTITKYVVEPMTMDNHPKN